MSGGFGEAASRPTQSSSFSNSSGEAGNFECNICFDLAEEPVVTLCGHLFCWPCLYRWLHMHSRSQECPICKALIEKEKLVPLYGRGTNSTSRSVPDVNIPNRPAGQRPETANRNRNRNRNAFVQNGLVGGIGPSMTATFGNFTFSFGGFVPSILNAHMHPHVYGYGNGHAPGYWYEGPHANEVRQQRYHHYEASPLLIIGLLFFFALLWG